MLACRDATVLKDISGSTRSSRTAKGRPGIHAGTPTGKGPAWIPDLRFASSGMTCVFRNIFQEAATGVR
jgi:hypothetical protein